MEQIGRTEPDFLSRETFEALAMTQECPEAWAKRIAAVLGERRRVAEVRRRRHREYQRRSAERADARHRQLRGELKGPGRRLNELDALYEAVISSTAADEAIDAHGMMEAS